MSFILIVIGSLLYPVQSGLAQTKSDLYSQGVVLLKQHKWTQAAAEFQQAVRSNPQNSQADAGLGVALARLGDGRGPRTLQAGKLLRNRTED